MGIPVLVGIGKVVVVNCFVFVVVRVECGPHMKNEPGCLSVSFNFRVFLRSEICVKVKLAALKLKPKLNVKLKIDTKRVKVLKWV